MRMRSKLGGSNSSRLRGGRFRVNYHNVSVRKVGYGQTCPRCKAFRLALRQNGKDKTWFWGCGSWPDCSFTRNLTSDEARDHVPGDKRNARPQAPQHRQANAGPAHTSRS